MEKGRVKKWTAKGYGFIELESGEDIFVHFSNLEDGRKHLNIGENVTFDIGDDERNGKQRAEKVVGDGTGEEPDLTPRDDFRRGGDRGYGEDRGRDRGYGGDRERDRGYGGGRGRGHGGRRDRGYEGRRDHGHGERRGGDRGKQVCYQFQSGDCSYGDRCRFSHDA